MPLSPSFLQAPDGSPLEYCDGDVVSMDDGSVACMGECRTVPQAHTLSSIRREGVRNCLTGGAAIELTSPACFQSENRRYAACMVFGSFVVLSLNNQGYAPVSNYTIPRWRLSQLPFTGETRPAHMWPRAPWALAGGARVLSHVQVPLSGLIVVAGYGLQQQSAPVSRPPSMLPHHVRPPIYPSSLHGAGWSLCHP